MLRSSPAAVQIRRAQSKAGNGGPPGPLRIEEPHAPEIRDARLGRQRARQGACVESRAGGGRGLGRPLGCLDGQAQDSVAPVSVAPVTTHGSGTLTGTHPGPSMAVARVGPFGLAGAPALRRGKEAGDGGIQQPLATMIHQAVSLLAGRHTPEAPTPSWRSLPVLGWIFLALAALVGLSGVSYVRQVPTSSATTSRRARHSFARLT